MIPKIIHYCWFGGKEIPKNLRACMESWKKLDGYEIMRWDESNCSFLENDYVRLAYAEKRWAWLSDYYRLKALNEYGGIYLDMDVLVKKSFDPLLENECFIGFLYSCVFSAAVIGAQKHAPIIQQWLQMYETGSFYVGENVLEPVFSTQNGHEPQWLPNTRFITWHLISTYPELKLNNRFQKLDGITLYPMEDFFTGRLSGDYYCRNVDAGSWIKAKQKAGVHGWLMHKIKDSEFLWVIYRSWKVRQYEKTSCFYDYRKSHSSRQS